MRLRQVKACITNLQSLDKDYQKTNLRLDLTVRAGSSNSSDNKQTG